MLLLNQLVNEGTQLRCRIFDVEPQRFGGVKIEDKFESRRLLYRQIAWLLTLEDAAGVLADEVVAPCQFATVAHQSAYIDIFAPRVHYRHRILCRERNDFTALAGEERGGGDQKRAHLLLSAQFEGRLDFAQSARLEETKLITLEFGRRHRLFSVNVWSDRRRVQQNADCPDSAS